VGPDDLRLRRFIGSAFREVSNLDGAVPRTLRSLTRHPGQLTAEYVEGRRRPYVRPFQLFIMVSLVFFLVVPRTGIFGYTYNLYSKPTALIGISAPMIEREIARTGIDEARYAEDFNKRIAAHKQTLMLFLVPLFAVGLVPLTRRAPYATHAVFSIHFFVMLLIFMLVWFAVVLLVVIPALSLLPRAWLDHGPKMSGDEAIILFVLLPMAVYLAKALKRVYGGATWLNALRAAALIAWFNVLIVIGYRTALFFTTYYSLKYFR
jgi:hypothetical protein